MTRFTIRRRVLQLAAVAALVFATAAPALARNTAFSIVNNSAQSIWHVYVSPDFFTEWGADWLGRDVIMPGERRQIAPGNADGCFYDVRVVYRNGEVETRYDQNLCAISEMVFTGSRARRINTSFDAVATPELVF